MSINLEIGAKLQKSGHYLKQFFEISGGLTFHKKCFMRLKALKKRFTQEKRLACSFNSHILAKRESEKCPLSK